MGDAKVSLGSLDRLGDPAHLGLFLFFVRTPGRIRNTFGLELANCNVITDLFARSMRSCLSCARTAEAKSLGTEASPQASSFATLLAPSAVSPPAALPTATSAHRTYSERLLCQRARADSRVFQSAEAVAPSAGYVVEGFFGCGPAMSMPRKSSHSRSSLLDALGRGGGGSTSFTPSRERKYPASSSAPTVLSGEIRLKIECSPKAF